MAEEKNVKKDRGRWFREMRSELKKVVWPAPDKVAKNTGTVILYSVLIGACIWVFDSVAALFIKTLLGLFSAVTSFFLQWGLYEAVARSVTSNDTINLISVVPFQSMWTYVAAIFAGAGMLIGVGGSLSAIRKFLQV